MPGIACTFERAGRGSTQHSRHVFIISLQSIGSSTSRSAPPVIYSEMVAGYADPLYLAPILKSQDPARRLSTCEILLVTGLLLRFLSAIRRRHARRAVAAVRCTAIWLLTSIYALSATGIGIPVPASSPSNEAYPCEHGRCGCRSAEQCWRSCCCHTDEEKLAWAAERGVVPPDYVVIAAEKSRAKRPCCAARTTSCCKASPCGHAAHASDCPKNSSTTKWITMIEAQRCRGTSTTWMSVTVGLPANAGALSVHPFERPTWLPIPSQSSYRSTVIAPPDPPPRLLRAKIIL